MSATVAEILETCERLWPLSGAESWDSPGLVCGSVKANVFRVLLTVDVTIELMSESAEYDLIIAHHPFLLKPLQTVAENTAKGLVLAMAMKSETAVFAAHTNADITDLGVSDTLAKALGLLDIEPLVPTSLGSSVGSGRVGKLAAPVSLTELAVSIARLLPSTASGVRVAGLPERQVQRIALCGGSGADFIDAASARGADVYITSDLRHHVALEAMEQARASGSGLSLIDVSHWAAEWLWLEQAARQLSEAHSSVKFEVSTLRTDPWDFAVTQ